MKAVNAPSSTHEFQTWGRSALPASLVLQDVDAWAIVASDPHEFEPLALFELKRSTIPASEWRPFPADRRNYAAMRRLAERAGIPFYGVYWQAGAPITSSTVFRVFEFSTVVPVYDGRAKLLSAGVFAERFPYPFGRPTNLEPVVRVA